MGQRQSETSHLSAQVQSLVCWLFVEINSAASNSSDGFKTWKFRRWPRIVRYYMKIVPPQDLFHGVKTKKNRLGSKVAARKCETRVKHGKMAHRSSKDGFGIKDYPSWRTVQRWSPMATEKNRAAEQVHGRTYLLRQIARSVRTTKIAHAI